MIFLQTKFTKEEDPIMKKRHKRIQKKLGPDFISGVSFLSVIALSCACAWVNKNLHPGDWFYWVTMVPGSFCFLLFLHYSNDDVVDCMTKPAVAIYRLHKKLKDARRIRAEQKNINAGQSTSPAETA